MPWPRRHGQHGRDAGGVGNPRDHTDCFPVLKNETEENRYLPAGYRNYCLGHRGHHRNAAATAIAGQRRRLTNCGRGHGHCPDSLAAGGAAHPDCRVLDRGHHRRVPGDILVRDPGPAELQTGLTVPCGRLGPGRSCIPTRMRSPGRLHDDPPRRRQR